MKNIFIFILSLFVFVTSSANERNCDSNLRKNALMLIEQAEANGWSSIYQFSFPYLKSLVQNNEVSIFCRKDSGISFNGRRAALWNDNGDSKAVLVHQSFLDDQKLDQKTLGALVTHELVTVQVHTDPDFQISSVLLFMADTPASNFKNGQFFLSDIRVEEVEGGSTGAGGGGDPTDLLIKRFIFEGYLNTFIRRQNNQPLSERQKTQLRLLLQLPLSVVKNSQLAPRYIYDSNVSSSCELNRVYSIQFGELMKSYDSLFALIDRLLTWRTEPHKYCEF